MNNNDIILIFIYSITILSVLLAIFIIVIEKLSKYLDKQIELQKEKKALYELLHLVLLLMKEAKNMPSIKENNHAKNE